MGVDGETNSKQKTTQYTVWVSTRERMGWVSGVGAFLGSEAFAFVTCL